MPLRDHFRAPVSDQHQWSELHGGWPMMLVRFLFDLLPPGYVAAPRVQLGQFFEIDVSAFDLGRPGDEDGASPHAGAGNGVATAAPPEPTLTLEKDLPEQDEFEVRIYNTAMGRELVAAVELVSPANKDRPETRRAFVAKLAALLQQGVCVSVVDVVTIRKFNMYADLLDLIGETDPKLGSTPDDLYAFTARSSPRKRQKRPRLDLWYYPMPLGVTLPSLPIWLSEDLCINVPLEPSYEETCRLLHIV